MTKGPTLQVVFPECYLTSYEGITFYLVFLLSWFITLQNENVSFKWILNAVLVLFGRILFGLWLLNYMHINYHYIIMHIEKLIIKYASDKMYIK